MKLKKVFEVLFLIHIDEPIWPKIPVWFFSHECIQDKRG